MKTETLQADPVHALEYFSRKMTFTTGPVELNRRIEQGEDLVIVDVREAEDFHEGHIPGAVNLPRSSWETLKGLRRDHTNILYCYSIVCHLAAEAAVGFAENGLSVMEMDGGFAAWKEHDLPVEK